MLNVNPIVSEEIKHTARVFYHNKDSQTAPSYSKLILNVRFLQVIV